MSVSASSHIVPTSATPCVTAVVALPGTATRPVTHCRACNEPIRDEMVNGGGDYVYHADCFAALYPGIWTLPPRDCWPTCRGCGRRYWRVGYPRRSGMCSSACRTARRRARIRARQPERLCDVCCAPIVHARRDARFCSGACRQRAYRRRKAQR